MTRPVVWKGRLSGSGEGVLTSALSCTAKAFIGKTPMKRVGGKRQGAMRLAQKPALRIEAAADTTAEAAARLREARRDEKFWKRELARAAAPDHARVALRLERCTAQCVRLKNQIDRAQGKDVIERYIPRGIVSMVCAPEAARNRRATNRTPRSQLSATVIDGVTVYYKEL